MSAFKVPGGGGGTANRENRPPPSQIPNPKDVILLPSAPAPSAPPTDKHKDDKTQANPEASIPSVLVDPTAGQVYIRGKLLGKGGFARCYEVTERKSKGILACKIVNKNLLMKQHQREKMIQEIKIHRDLKHEFVVNFFSYFEDDANVYITLELCSNKSLMELQKRRRLVTEPEAKYFIRQIVLAVQYLHDEKHIIHRDLKLGNIFITEDMRLKLGDFGLATTIMFDGERKKTLCGTPNYIAPEILGKKGHSYQVDLWSIGCILYTLLVGKPPFETSSLRDTYHRIRRGEYAYPQKGRVSQFAKNLLNQLLQVNPDLRPTARQIMASDFMKHGYIPSTLPSSVLIMAPRFDRPTTSMVPPTSSARPVPLPQPRQPEILCPGSSRHVAMMAAQDAAASFKKPEPLAERNLPQETVTNDKNPAVPTGLNMSNTGPYAQDMDTVDLVENIKILRNQIKRIIDLNKEKPRLNDDDENEDPSQSPLLWICKWVDYSDKYGFGYHLSDDSVGVSFNDQTKIILLADAKSLHYIDKDGMESYHSLAGYPRDLHKKVKLLEYFQQYMQDNLIKATGGRTLAPPDCIARVPAMWTWFRTSRSVVMVLSSGTLQINNFRDHSKMILCPLLNAITTMGRGPNKAMQTYKLNGMEENGLSAEMWERLNYALEKLDTIVDRCNAVAAAKKSSSTSLRIDLEQDRVEQEQMEVIIGKAKENAVYTKVIESPAKFKKPS